MESETIEIIRCNITKPQGLLTILNQCESDAQISTILSYPDRVQDDSIADYIETLAERWAEMLSETSGGDIKIDTPLFDRFFTLTRRALVLKCGNAFALELIRSPVQSTLWTAVFSKLSIESQFCLFKAVFTRLVADLTPKSSEMCLSGQVPLSTDENIGMVERSDVDAAVAKMQNLFGQVLTNDSYLDLYRYIRRKVLADMTFVEMILPARFILVGMFSLSTDNAKQLFMDFYSLWSNQRFGNYNSSDSFIRYVTDLMIIAMRGLEGSANATIESLKQDLSQSFSRTIGVYIESPIPEIRQRSLLAAEYISSVLYDGNGVQFDQPESADSRWIHFITGKSTSFLFDNAEIHKVIPKDQVAEAIRMGDSDDESDVSSLDAFETDESTQRNILTVPPPRHLQECIDYLKHSEDAEAPARIDICLRTIPELLMNPRNRNLDHEVACKLLTRILHQNDNDNIQSFSENKRRCLIALVTRFPQQAGLELIDNLWNSTGLNISQRLQIFDFLLSVIQTTEEKNSNFQNWTSACYQVLDRGMVGAASIDPSQHIVPSKTRITHPRSLALRSEQTRNLSGNNRVWQNVDFWFLPLTRGLWTSRIQWIKKDAKTFVDIRAKPKPSDSSHHIQLTSLTLFCRLLTTAVTMVHLCGPNDPKIIDKCKEVGYLFSWFWNLMSTSKPQKNITVSQATEAGKHDSIIVSTGESSGESLLLHPQVKLSIMYTLRTCLVLESNIQSCSYKQRVLPFNWDQLVDVVDVVKWLRYDVMCDMNLRHRQVAATLLDNFKSRIERLEM